MKAENPDDTRRQYRVFAVLSMAVIAMTALLRSAPASLFRSFTGALDPVVAVAGVSAVGSLVLSVLLARGGFAVYRNEWLRGLTRATGLAAAFGVVVVIADLILTHPKDINVAFPQSLLFYPVIGFVAEIVFHLLPLSLLLVVLPALRKGIGLEKVVSVSIVCVAALEPTFQAVLMVSQAPLIGAPSRYGAATVVFDWLQIFGINFAQLRVFRRYDFISMYWLRLVYYAIWHIGWGHIRLHLLF